MFKASYISRLYVTLYLAVLLAIGCKKTSVNADSIGTIYIGSNNGYIHAVRASDGKAMGVYKSPRNLYTTTTIDPIVYNNILYTTDDSTHIYALDAISGTPKWLQPFDIKTVYNANYGYINAPLFYPIVYNNILYITYVTINQSRKQIFAVDLATGQAMKNFNGIIKEGFSPIPTEPIIAHKGNIYSICRDTLYIIDAITGNLKTGYTPTAVKDYTNGEYITPIIHNNILYLSAGDRNAAKLYAVDANNGTIIPGYPINIANGTYIIGISKVYNNTLYLTTAIGGSSSIYAFDINAKSLKPGFQTFEIGGSTNFLSVNSGTVAAEDGVICIGSGNNRMVYGIDANSGAKLWQFDAQGTVSSSPVVYKGTIYIGGATALYALDLKTGTKKWEYLTKGEVSSNPCLVTNDGKILAKTVNAED